MKTTSISDLQQQMTAMWMGALASPTAREIKEVLALSDPTHYVIWLCQVAHLTKHTPKHQAMVAARSDVSDHQYIRYCLRHALEEVGHELMAINDLKKMGLQVSTVNDLPQALPATLELNNYLYQLAEHGHPFARLGFSYWAEKCYPFLSGLAGSIQTSLGLNARQMTFFVNHSEIDEKHAKDVEFMVAHVCKTPADWEAVSQGMSESFSLSVNIFENVVRAAQGLRTTSTQYTSFVSSLPARAA